MHPCCTQGKAVRRIKKARPRNVVVWPRLEPYILEAWTGIEPVNNGFADRSLSHLGTTPEWIHRSVTEWRIPLERAMGLEPTAFCLGSRRSTTELRPRNRHYYSIPCH